MKITTLSYLLSESRGLHYTDFQLSAHSGNTHRHRNLILHYHCYEIVSLTNVYMYKYAVLFISIDFRRSSRDGGGKVEIQFIPLFVFSHSFKVKMLVNYEGECSRIRYYDCIFWHFWSPSFDPTFEFYIQIFPKYAEYSYELKSIIHII